MADLNLSKVTGGLKIVSEVSSFVVNEYSTKINNLDRDEISIISDIKDNYAEFDIDFAHYDNVLYNGEVVADALGLESLLEDTTAELDVTLQDQATPSIIAKFNRVLNSTETVGAVAINDTTVTLDDTTEVAVGSYLVFFNPTSVRFMTATITSIATIPTVEIDTPFDFAFPAGTFVDVTNTNMAVDGSTTPVIFGLRGVGVPLGVNIVADITRIIISCTATSAVDLSKFANFAKLIKGLVLRKRDGVYENILNIKSNREMAGIMYDWTPFASTNPQQGIDGFVARLTFSGQSKIGVVKRLALGDDLEVIIQDDLLTAQGGESITELEIVAEGHIVE